MLSTLFQFEAWVATIERFIIFCAIALLTVDLTLQVATRFLLPTPLAYTVELARFGQIWLVFIGSAHATYVGQHFVVSILLDRLRFPGKRILETSLDLIVIGFFAWLAYYGALLAIGTPQIYPALHMPVAISYLALPVGAAAMVFHLSMAFVRLCLGYRRVPEAGADHAAEPREAEQ